MSPLEVANNLAAWAQDKRRPPPQQSRLARCGTSANAVNRSSRRSRRGAARLSDDCHQGGALAAAASNDSCLAQLSDQRKTLATSNCRENLEALTWPGGTCNHLRPVLAPIAQGGGARAEHCARDHNINGGVRREWRVILPDGKVPSKRLRTIKSATTNASQNNEAAAIMIVKSQVSEQVVKSTAERQCQANEERRVVAQLEVAHGGAISARLQQATMDEEEVGGSSSWRMINCCQRASDKSLSRFRGGEDEKKKREAAAGRRLSRAKHAPTSSRRRANCWPTSTSSSSSSSGHKRPPMFASPAGHLSHHRLQTKPSSALFIAALSTALVVWLAISSSLGQSLNEDDATTTNRTLYSHKLELWRSLLKPLYATTTKRASSAQESQAIEQLAMKLTRWPDQRKAALFYVDQLARQLESEEAPSSRLFCRQISWAQLNEQVDESQSRSSLERQVALDQLSGGRERHLSRMPATSGAARLALELANLISKLLLIQPGGGEDEVGGVLDDKVSEQQQRGGFLDSLFSAFKPAISVEEARQLNNDATMQVEREAAELIKDTQNLEMMLNSLVRPDFLRYLLETKLADYLAHNQKKTSPAELIHSLGVILIDHNAERPKDEINRDLGRPLNTKVNAREAISQVRASFAARAQLEEPPRGKQNVRSSTKPIIKIVNLLTKSNVTSTHGGGGQFKFEEVPSFLARWLLANEAGQLAQLSKRLSGKTQLENKQRFETPANHLQLTDGAWFSPYFECSLSKRWLLTYSVPFFARAQSASNARFRGVAFVGLDLAHAGQLINQCSSNPTSSLLANTNECLQRLPGSQCVPLPPGQLFRNAPLQFRPGAYACQCASNWAHLSPASLHSAQQRRKQLIELLEGTSTSTAAAHAKQSQLLDEQTGDNGGESLSFIGFHLDDDDDQQKRPQAQLAAAAVERLLGQQAARAKRQNATESSATNATSSQVAAFELGTRLERDATLEWLAAGQANWAWQACQSCASNRKQPPIGSSKSPTETECQLAPPSTIGASDLLQSGTELVRGSASPFSIGSEQNNDQNDENNNNNNTSWLTCLRPIVLILQCFCLVVTLGLICVILRIRKSRLILVSGWLMLETMLAGAVLLHLSILVRYFQPTSLTCLLEPWLRELGFSIFYGSILIKLYRILTEFQTRKAHRVCLRDKDQAVYLLAIVLIVIGYMSAWTALMVDGFFVSPASDTADKAFSLAESNPNFGLELPDSIELLPPGENFESSNLRKRRSSEHTKGQLTTSLELDFREGAPEVREKIDGQLREWPHAQNRMPNTREEAPRQVRKAPTLALDSNGGITAAADEEDEEEVGADDERGGRLTPAASQQGRHQNEKQQQQQQQLEEQHKQEEKEEDERQQSDKRTSLVNEHLEILARGLNSFGELFLGLLETQQFYEHQTGNLVYLIRCRKLTWDYVTESSEIALLLFGLHLVYKLRNASSEVHREKLILSVAIFVELLISTCVYLARHAFWQQLSSDHLLVLYALRCQLTVTLTVALVFGPKLWQIGKSKPGLLFGALFNYSFHQQYHHERHQASHCSASGGGGGQSTNAGANTATLAGALAGSEPGSAGATSGVQGSATAASGGGGKRGNSVRHRCHISCELHDHHLGDASRLQQAMLSNSALEIGSINLADMDPDEIQAELKRVYTQLEVLKTKVMRRDNPHISKRRGGRKPGHRKFSLQAFHNRSHSSSGEQHQAATAALTGENAQADQQAASRHLASLQQQQQQQQQAATGGRLPALAELVEGDTASNCGANQRPPGLLSSGKRALTGQTSNSSKHVRVDDKIQEFAAPSTAESGINNSARRQQNKSCSNHFKPSSLTSKLISKATNRRSNQQQQQQQSQQGGARHRSKWTPELPSTSSLGLDDETIMAMNDSQSSGEVTPQHRSSIVYGNASYHTDEPPPIK